MRVTQEKIHQYVGIKYGEDIANELKNWVEVVIDQPEYTQAIKNWHVEYQALVWQKQSNLAQLTSKIGRFSKLAAM